jgi:HK97 family phage portal protein
MGLVAVYAAATLIAGAAGSLPTRIGQRAAFADDRPAMFPALWDRPNPLQTQQAVRESVLLSLLLWGNAYEGLTWSEGGALIERWVIDPARVTSVVVDKSGAVKFTITNHGDVIVMPDDPRPRLLHTPGPTLPGRVLGMSPIETVMNHIGIAQAVERTAAGFYKNGMTPGGIVEVKGRLSAPQAREYAARMRGMVGGTDRAGSWAVMDEGATLHPISIPPQQAQFVEQQRYTDRKIASIFRVPPHLISDVDASTSWGTGIEEQTIAFVVYTLTPWLTRIESAIESRLLRDTGYQYRHMLQGLMRGSMKARYDSYAIGRQQGWLNVNDVRALEDMRGIGAAGDVYLTPLNMAPATEASPAGESAQAGGEATAPAPAETVQELALNGAQIASLLTIVQQVTARQVSADTARDLLRVAFPAMAEGLIASLVASAAAFVPDPSLQFPAAA